jgi:hypothetical protein
VADSGILYVLQMEIIYKHNVKETPGEDKGAFWCSYALKCDALISQIHLGVTEKTHVRRL